MKHGKKPTVKQCKVIRSWGLNYENWLVIKDTPTEMVLVNRYGSTVKTLTKWADE